MSKYLVVLIWPAGMAAILGCGWLLTRGRMVTPAPGSGLRRAHRNARDAARDGALLVALTVVGAAAVFAVMCAVGVLVVNHGLAIDRPVFTWVHGHQVHAVAAAMKRLTKIGDTWTVWGAAGAAAVCLAVASRRRRWLPPAAFAALVVIDHYTTLALRHVFHRVGPPTSPLGTFPSGGCDRCIVFYGLIAYLLWREFSGRRPAAIWAACAVAALGFNEAYSRVYLSLHWLTDALSGLLYGGLLLCAFIAAVRFVESRTPEQADGERRPRPAADRTVTGAVPHE